VRSNPRGGAAFDDPDVARAYLHRPPYPAALYGFLAELAPRRLRALDLGCGTGKLAHGLAPYFQHVDAVDPSLPMLRLADDGWHDNITWIYGFAETAPLDGPYDLIVAGASIHWMDHAALFPKLAGLLSERGVLAVIEGDEAHDTPWDDEWVGFLTRWLERLGDRYSPGEYRAAMTAFRLWLMIAGERVFEDRFSQSIDDFIECQHSRASWSRANLGPLTAEFDADLLALLRPHARDGMLHYTTRTEVVWGRPRPDLDGR
jgi:SAM-dependent methyltransferase